MTPYLFGLEAVNQIPGGQTKAEQDTGCIKLIMYTCILYF